MEAMSAACANRLMGRSPAWVRKAGNLLVMVVVISQQR